MVWKKLSQFFFWQKKLIDSGKECFKRIAGTRKSFRVHLQSLKSVLNGFMAFTTLIILIFLADIVKIITNYRQVTKNAIFKKQFAYLNSLNTRVIFHFSVNLLFLFDHADVSKILKSALCMLKTQNMSKYGFQISLRTWCIFWILCALIDSEFTLPSHRADSREWIYSLPLS